MTRMASITCICLLSLLSLVAGSPAGQHSLEKRQTTVSKSRLAFSNCLFITPFTFAVKSGKLPELSSKFHLTI